MLLAPESGGITRGEALELLAVQGEELELLLRRAADAREARFGREVRLCAICNARSGACPERCDFCAQSAAFDTDAPVFPMKPASEIAGEAQLAHAAGATHFSIVTSGRSLRHGRDMAQVDEALRLMERETGLQRCASLGELPVEELARLRAAGLQRYHHNIETAPSFHPRIVHTHSYDDEVQVVHAAREAGLLTCCGGILGMGETPEQRVEMAFALRDLTPDSVPLNFLDPRPGTPLSGLDELTPMECLRITAIFRLVLPGTPILICGGRERNLGRLQSRVFEAGATGAMIGDYLTTPGQPAAQDREMIQAAGLAIERADRP